MCIHAPGKEQAVSSAVLHVCVVREACVRHTDPHSAHTDTLSRCTVIGGEIEGRSRGVERHEQKHHDEARSEAKQAVTSPSSHSLEKMLMVYRSS